MWGLSRKQNMATIASVCYRSLIWYTELATEGSIRLHATIVPCGVLAYGVLVAPEGTISVLVYNQCP